jgi:sugar fermentation stimulation protein A
MNFPAPLKPATLIRRYKRFLADIRLADKSQLTVHCPNSGSMKSCSDPGSPVYYSTSDNPARKYPQTLEMVHSGSAWVGINTARTNGIVVEGLENGLIRELWPIDSLVREVKTSPDCRLDLLAESGGRQVYIEVKNCSYVDNGYALFPDAVTARGTKHLLELARLVREGRRGVIIWLVQRLDADRFAPAAQIDPHYAETLAAVSRQGVELLAYQAAVTPESIEIVRSLPITFNNEQHR